MTTNLLRGSSALVLLLSQAAFANDTTDIGEIIISGGFTPVEERQYGRSANVITEDDIKTRGITTVAEALRALPGVSVSGTGLGDLQVRIRGGEANNTLILIDGVPAAAGMDEYRISGLQTANIARIEVLRGPQSVFYGSSASSGVVNIITKTGAIGREITGKLELGAATTASMSYSHRGEQGGVALGLSHLKDSGYDFSGSNGEKDGIERNTITLKGDHNLSDTFKIGLNLRHTDEVFDTDTFNYSATSIPEMVVDAPNDTTDRTERLAQIYAQYETPNGRMKHRLSFETGDFESLSSSGYRSQARFSTARYLMSASLDGADLDSTNHLINVIAEHTEKRSATNSGYRPDRNSYAVEYRGDFNNGLSLQGGVRHDDNSAFEDSTTWTLSAAYEWQNGVRLHASAGTGSVDPSFFELFGNLGTTRGNPNLTPEKNESYDLGVEIPVLQGRGMVDITVFDETLTDEIEWYFDAGLGYSTYRNRDGKSSRRGVEISGELEASDTVDLRLSYTYVDAHNPDGSIEVRRPEHELLLSAKHSFRNGRGSVNADLRYVAGNYDTQYYGVAPWSVVAKLPNYATVDVAARYELRDNLMLTGRVNNLFDKKSTDVWGYAKRGRAIYVGLESKF